MNSFLPLFGLMLLNSAEIAGMISPKSRTSEMSNQSEMLNPSRTISDLFATFV